ncbi:restriction endonuclease [Massilia sp. W12]|uniref:restriction endonuclease n=1 Tax=Massilia sp. W12 TaxID=3126507 RepID=UPI0030CC9A8D
MTEPDFPSDFPPHLNENAAVKPIRTAMPIGQHSLDFKQMNDTQFEQFCWWLIRKDHHLLGCQRIGGSGQKQDGIDIFARAKLHPAQLVVFECKCWHQLSSREMVKAVDRFLGGKWLQPGARFVLIIAQDTVGKLVKTWDKQSARLKEQQIEAELWTGMHLTEAVQPFPDIVSKFFTGEAVSAFANEWMQKVGFIERLHKALIDERVEVRALAERYLDNTDARGKIETIHHVDDNWRIALPWVHMLALLPGKRFYPGSASIEIQKADTSGLAVVLSQSWLMENFIGMEGFPNVPAYRPFLLGESRHNPAGESYMVNLENCRLRLPIAGVKELLYAADKLSGVFIDALHQKELEWGAQDFPFIGQGVNQYVALCAIPKQVWPMLLEFAWEHDAEAGESAWHIFDQNRFYLKLYTVREHANFDRAYHGFFYARENLDGLSFNDDVVILWHPPFDDAGCSSRGWLSCAEALRWLSSELLPAVGAWVAANALKRKRWFSKARAQAEIAAEWAEYARIRDVRIQPLLREQRYRKLGLLATIEILQSEVGVLRRELYLSTQAIKRLYRAMLPILQGERGYSGYISNKLSLKANSHQEIIAALHLRLQQETLSLSNFSLDCTLRACLEALKDADDWLAMNVKEEMFAALTPIMQFVDTQNLFKRHSEWS